MGAIDEMLPVALMDCIQVIYYINLQFISELYETKFYGYMFIVDWINTNGNYHCCWTSEHLSYDTNVHSWNYFLQNSSFLFIDFSKCQTIGRS